MNTSVTGTIKELSGRLSINGVTLNQPQLSFLTSFGDGTFARKVGTVKNPAGQRGKPATIWEIDLSANLSFAYDNAPAVVAAPVAPVTVAAVENAPVEDSSSDESEPTGWDVPAVPLADDLSMDSAL